MTYADVLLAEVLTSYVEMGAFAPGSLGADYPRCAALRGAVCALPGIARYLGDGGGDGGDGGDGGPTRFRGVLTDPAAAAAYVANVNTVLGR